MSEYPNPPDPYGQNPYDPPSRGHGQPAYGAPSGGYAHWGKRVGASVIDILLTLLAALPAWVGYGMIASTATTRTNADGRTDVSFDGSATATGLVLVGAVTYLAFFIWNTFIKQGRTGYTIGKGVLGIRLLHERSGAPLGAGMAFVRQIAHFVDSIVCYLGYLWPLWDRKRQTFADKILGSVVVNQPKA